MYFKPTIEIVMINDKGKEVSVSAEFISPYDAAKCVAMQASMGLPRGIVEIQARFIESKEWIAKVNLRAEIGTQDTSGLLSQ